MKKEKDSCSKNLNISLGKEIEEMIEAYKEDKRAIISIDNNRLKEMKDTFLLKMIHSKILISKNVAIFGVPSDNPEGKRNKNLQV
jgi:hypothetical protein